MTSGPPATPKLKRAASRQGDRDHAEQQPERHPDTDRDEGHLGIALDAVAKEAPDLGLPAGGNCDHQAIAEFDRQVG